MNIPAIKNFFYAISCYGLGILTGLLIAIDAGYMP